MHEGMPTPEKTPEKKEEKASGEFDLYLSALNKFLTLSDEPGRFVKDEEKVAAVRESERLGHETPELKAIMESKVGSKYRAGAFQFLMWAKELLTEKKVLESVAGEELEQIKSEVDNLFNKIQEIDLKNEPITIEEVDRGVSIINKLKSVIEKLSAKKSSAKFGPQYWKTVKEKFDNYRDLTAEPGQVLTDEEKYQLSQEAKKSPEGFKKWEEERLRKHRVNSMTVPLMAAEIFLAYPQNSPNVPEDERKKLLNKISTVNNDILNREGLVTDQHVNEVLDVIKAVELYLRD